jgi:hypothetical protein
MDTSEQRARQKLYRALASVDTVNECGSVTYWGDERLHQHLLGVCLSDGDVDVATLISTSVLFNEFVRKASTTGPVRVAQSLIRAQKIKDRH